MWEFEPIIGNKPFGLKETDVTATIQELQNAQVKEQRLVDSYPDLQIVREDLRMRIRSRLAFLTDTSMDEILNQCRLVYFRTLILGDSIQDTFTLARQLNKDFPNLRDYYSVLSKTEWGIFLVRILQTIDDLDKGIKIPLD